MGGAATRDYAVAEGAQFLLITSSRESVEASIQQAIEQHHLINDVLDKNRLFQSVIDKSGSAVFIFGEQRELQYTNVAARKMLNDVERMEQFLSRGISTLQDTGTLHLIKKLNNDFYEITGGILQVRQEIRYLFEVHFRIHTKSATEGTTLMRLQCRDLTEKNWDMLLNNAASPIHATGYTVYLENVDTLPKDLQQQVGTYIEDTKMTHRHRVISSSCCDLSAEVARGQFSSRLYLQLSGFTINVPSLAQRKEDIPAFVNMMIPQYNTALAKSTVGMEPDAMELMVEFEWPLNLVQLEKVLRQMIAASSGFYITAAEVAAVLQNEMRKVSALPPAVDLSGTLEDIERRVIEQVLREENMNQSAAAKRLGIGRSTLWRKIAGSGGK